MARQQRNNAGPDEVEAARALVSFRAPPPVAQRRPTEQVQDYASVWANGSKAYEKVPQGPHLALDGTRIYELFRHRAPGGGGSYLRWHRGFATYLGHHAGVACFLIAYDDAYWRVVGVDELHELMQHMRNALANMRSARNAR